MSWPLPAGRHTSYVGFFTKMKADGRAPSDRKSLKHHSNDSTLLPFYYQRPTTTTHGRSAS